VSQSLRHNRRPFSRVTGRAIGGSPANWRMASLALVESCDFMVKNGMQLGVAPFVLAPVAQ